MQQQFSTPKSQSHPLFMQILTWVKKKVQFKIRFGAEDVIYDLKLLSNY